MNNSCKCCEANEEKVETCCCGTEDCKCSEGCVCGDCCTDCC